MARFIRRGVSKIRFAPTIANINAVTRTEITGSTDLSPQIADMSGFQLSGSQVATPDMGSDFEGSIPGGDSAGDSSITFYEDDATNVIETLLPKGTDGFVLLMRKGDIPTNESLDVFPVTVGSRSAEWTTGNEAARFNVQFFVTAKPALDTEIPAAI